MQVRPDSLFARYAERLASQDKAVGESNSSGASASNFLDLMKQGVGQVNSMQQDANTQVESMLTGGDVQSAEVMVGLQKADMAFRLLVQIRNKLMDAYQEINGIRV
jgi:flagellar hook-basal body complex protein FliE